MWPDLVSSLACGCAVEHGCLHSTANSHCAAAYVCLLAPVQALAACGGALQLHQGCLHAHACRCLGLRALPWPTATPAKRGTAADPSLLQSTHNCAAGPAPCWVTNQLRGSGEGALVAPAASVAGGYAGRPSRRGPGWPGGPCAPAKIEHEQLMELSCCGWWQLQRRSLVSLRHMAGFMHNLAHMHRHTCLNAAPRQDWP